MAAKAESRLTTYRAERRESDELPAIQTDLFWMPQRPLMADSRVADRPLRRSERQGQVSGCKLTGADEHRVPATVSANKKNALNRQAGSEQPFGKVLNLFVVLP
jgi:hypothetical protein